jgi:hypothetical protein
VKQFGNQHQHNRYVPRNQSPQPHSHIMKLLCWRCIAMCMRRTMRRRTSERGVVMCTSPSRSVSSMYSVRSMLSFFLATRSLRRAFRASTLSSIFIFSSSALVMLSTSERERCFSCCFSSISLLMRSRRALPSVRSMRSRTSWSSNSSRFIRPANTHRGYQQDRRKVIDQPVNILQQEPPEAKPKEKMLAHHSSALVLYL